MKFIHLADLHFGKNVHGFSMIEHQGYFVDAILGYAEKKDIDAIVIAGDIYDKAVPSVEAVNLFDRFIQGAVDRGIYLYMASGNHDNHDRLNYATTSLVKNHVYLVGRFDGTIRKYWYRDDYGKVNFWLLPYVKASTIRHYYPDAEIETYEDAVRTVIENAGVDKSERNVIVSHQFVSSHDSEVEMAGSEVVNIDTVGTVERISPETYDPFDYVALGHIHSPQSIGRNTVRYSGSPLKYSLREVDHKKTFPVVTMNEKGDISLEIVKIKPRYDMRHLRGKLDDLVKNAVSTEDFIYITLTDEMPFPDAMNIMRKCYPNIMHLDYAVDQKKNESELEYKNPFENKPFREIIEGFYSKSYNREMSEDEWKIVEELAGKAGIEL